MFGNLFKTIYNLRLVQKYQQIAIPSRYAEIQEHISLPRHYAPYKLLKESPPSLNLCISSYLRKMSYLLLGPRPQIREQITITTMLCTNCLTYCIRNGTNDPGSDSTYVPRSHWILFGEPSLVAEMVRKRDNWRLVCEPFFASADRTFIMCGSQAWCEWGWKDLSWILNPEADQHVS